MKALFRNIVIALCTIVCTPVFASQLYQGPYMAKVERIVDGDTFVATINIWPSISAHGYIRVRGINTPEVRTRVACEKRDGLKAKALAEQFLLGKNVVLRNVSPDKFGGRFLADVETTVGNYASWILRTGYAIPYNGKGKHSWSCK